MLEMHKDLKTLKNHNYAWGTHPVGFEYEHREFLMLPAPIPRQTILMYPTGAVGEIHQTLCWQIDISTDIVIFDCWFYDWCSFKRQLTPRIKRFVKKLPNMVRNICLQMPIRQYHAKFILIWLDSPLKKSVVTEIAYEYILTNFLFCWKIET